MIEEGLHIHAEAGKKFLRTHVSLAVHSLKRQAVCKKRAFTMSCAWSMLPSHTSIGMSELEVQHRQLQ